MMLNNVKVRTKLMGGFILLAGLTVIVGSIGIIKMRAIERESTFLYSHITVPLSHVGEIASLFQKVRVQVLYLARAQSSAECSEAEKKVLGYFDAMGKGLKDFEDTTASQDLRDMAKDLAAAQSSYHGQFASLLLLKKEGNADAGEIQRNLQLCQEAAQHEETVIENMTAAAVRYADETAILNDRQQKSAANEMLVYLLIAVAFAVGTGLFITISITGPLRKAMDLMNDLARGKADRLLNAGRKDEIGLLSDSIDHCVKTLQSLIMDTNALVAGALAGKLDTRVDTAKHQGDFRKVIEGMNATLDAVVGPLNVAAEYVGRISKGDIPPKITENYKGDFNEIKNNLNGCIDAVKALITDSNTLTLAAVEGRLDTRVDATKHQGDFRKIVEGVNATLDALVRPLQRTFEHLEHLSSGIVNETITGEYKGDYIKLKDGFNRAFNAVKALIADTETLTAAAVAGNLAERADATKYQGDFRKIVEGVNATLDAVIMPLNMTAEYVDCIAKGDIPPKITENYKGDFNKLKNSLNACIDAVQSLITDSNTLTLAAVEGRLDTRVDATKHQGDFRKIVEGVNATLDALVRPLQRTFEHLEHLSNGIVNETITGEYKGDYIKLKDGFNRAFNAVKALISDSNALALAAVEGRLDARADATKYQGDFRKIVEGVNATLDAVIVPLNVTAEYVGRISKGDIPPKITENYRGDFNAIKNNLNGCIESLSGLISETDTLARAAVEGKLSTRGNTEKFQGGYRRIVSGFNDTLDAVLVPVHDAIETLEKIAGGKFTARMLKDYRGDHARMKENINRVVETLRPIDEALSVFVHMADNDFTHFISGEYHSEQAIRIKTNVNKVLDILNNSIRQMSDSTNQVAITTQELSTTAEQMASGAEEQTTQAAQVATSMEEMSATIQEVAKSSNNAALKAKEAGETAANGGEVVKQTLEGINKIEDSVKELADVIQSLSGDSEKIGDVIGVIDDVADQTNLLALNAAIEAARAGEQGRGFAVVADEVRKLAERTISSTKEISGMVKNIQENTAKAVKAMDRSAQEVQQDVIFAISAGNCLDEILSNTKMVEDMIQQIATAAEEQSAAVEEISANVEAIASVSKQNSNGARQTAVVTQDLGQQTIGLQSIVQNFKICAAGESSSPAPLGHGTLHASVPPLQ